MRFDSSEIGESLTELNQEPVCGTTASLTASTPESSTSVVRIRSKSKPLGPSCLARAEAHAVVLATICKSIIGCLSWLRLTPASIVSIDFSISRCCAI